MSQTTLNTKLVQKVQNGHFFPACAAGYYGTADAGGNNAATCVKCPPKTWKEAGGSNTAGFQLCIRE